MLLGAVYELTFNSVCLLYLYCSYSITFTNPSTNVFDIVTTTGELRVTRPLDRDTLDGGEYNLRVQARDGGIPMLRDVVSVKVIVQDVNDNAPSFRYPSYE